MSLPSFSRASRIERQAYMWVMNMLDDPGRHAPALERWLARDPEHRAVYKRVAVEVGYASDAAASLPSLRVEASSNPGAAVWRPTGTLAVAAGLAAALAAVLIYMFAWQSIRPASAPPSTSTQPAELVTIENGTKSLKLVDGSIVTLLGASALNVAYTASERKIELLRGRARFEVEHDTGRPFVVYVGGGKVTAVGTIFEVRADRRVAVRLVSGLIRVSLPSASGRAPKPDLMLNSGQQVEFDGSSPENGRQGPAEGGHPPAVRTQSFDDVPVSALIEQLNRLSSQKVVLLDHETAGRKIFADLDISDADAVARKIALMFGLTIDRSMAGQIRLSKKM